MIYFAQPIGGGPIKCGSSQLPDIRARTLSPWSPTGVEIITTIPGGVVREQALLWALRPFRHHGEWLRACPAIWRLILEAIDIGDLVWLPPEPATRSYGNADAVRAAVDWLGGVEAAAEALGYKPISFGAPLAGHASTHMMARYAIERARRDGRLPTYLLDAAPDAEAA